MGKISEKYTQPNEENTAIFFLWGLLFWLTPYTARSCQTSPGQGVTKQNHWPQQPTWATRS